MGVPALFRWLSKKYPKIVSEVKEEDEPENGRPIDMSADNPNGMGASPVAFISSSLAQPACRV